MSTLLTVFKPKELFMRYSYNCNTNSISLSNVQGWVRAVVNLCTCPVIRSLKDNSCLLGVITLLCSNYVLLNEIDISSEEIPHLF